jgi:hypothetical protein
MQAAFWGIIAAGIVLVLAGLLLLCWCFRNRLMCCDAPAKGECERVRMEIENPRRDVTVDLGTSNAIDGGSGGVTMTTSKISAMHGEPAASPADRLEELHMSMMDAGGENQVPPLSCRLSTPAAVLLDFVLLSLASPLSCILASCKFCLHSLPR